ncbi:MAG: methyltransferase domain-containing protein [Pseudomonadota bacterium]
MSLKVSEGLTEDGVVVGNAYDKYGSKNPIVKKIMAGFDSSLSQLVERSAPKNIHEVGCGEGYWSLQWSAQNLKVNGSDFSPRVIEIARQNAIERGLPDDIFKVRSIYDLDEIQDKADLVVCCEVLEHLENPELGLQTLRTIVGSHLIVSVPREPLWRALNLARGKYIRALGNTPGHLQHWSSRSFVKFVSTCFDVVEIRKPLPWTLLLCRHKAS